MVYNNLSLYQNRTSMVSTLMAQPLQAMATRGTHRRVVVNDTTDLSEGLPVVNDTTNLSEGLPVINDTTDLSEGLPVINNTTDLSEGLVVINNTTDLSEGLPVINNISAKMTCVIDDLCGR